MNKVIEVENLSKKYKIGSTSYKVLREDLLSIINPFKSNKSEEFWPLKDISFSVDRGDILGVIGRNGAGKTTLLKILSKITYPTSGIVKMHGRVGSLLEVGTGFHPELSGRENIYLNGSVLGMKKNEIKRKFDDIVEFSGIGKFLDTPVKKYSSGMSVRLAFSVAAYLEPEILLIDEVLSVGDQYFQKKSLGKMDEVAREEGRTVLFVSHNLDVVRRICNKVLLINEGKVLFMGDTGEGIEKYLSMVRAQEMSIERMKRDGNGGIRINSMKILNSKNEETKNIDLGESMKFVFDYEAKVNDLTEIVVGLTLGSEFTPIAANLGSMYTEKPFSLKSKKGSFELTIPKVLLFPGVYQVNVSIRRKGLVEDSITAFTEFIINETNYFGQNDLPPRHHQNILFDYSWEVK